MARATAPAVRLTGVAKSFGEGYAVSRVDLSIAQNEFFSILGPSGCGKTTLMRMITGFETPTEGEIELNGVPASGLPAHKRDLNMLFQSYALFPHLDVYENVAFELKVRKKARASVPRAVRDALALVRLEGYEKRRISQLSGGQRQRVALARALVSHPSLILLDEPLGALDQKLRADMQLELKRLQREVGVTFVYVTHDQEEALTMSDRIAVMEAGRILQVDTPRAIYESPATRFVANFIGTSNFLSGRLARGGTALAVDGLGEIPVPRTDLPDGTGVHLAVRPENVRVTAAGTPVESGAVSLRATLRQEVYLGSGVRYHCALPGELPFVAEVAGAQGDAVAVGDEVVVSWSPQRSRVLAE